MTEQRDGDCTNADTGPCIRAFVHIGACEIAYSRRGNGAPVLLIASDARLRERLFVGLAARFKVVAPALQAGFQSIPSGILLRELIDGIGLARPHLVVAGPASVAALHFAIGDPERIDRVVIVWSDRGVERSGDPVLEEHLLLADRHLLMLRGDDANPDDHAELAAISGFLSADATCS